MESRKMPSWKEKSTLDKVLQIVQILLSVVVIILCILQLSGVWTGAINVVEPLMAVVMLIMSWQYRTYNKLMSLFCLAVAIFVTSVTIRLFFF